MPEKKATKKAAKKTAKRAAKKKKKKRAAKRVQVGRLRAKLNDPETRERLVEAVGIGMPYTVACELVGIPRSTFNHWVQTGTDALKRREDGAKLTDNDKVRADFVLALHSSNASIVEKCLSIVMKHAKGKWQAAAWFLERRHPEHFGRKSPVNEESAKEAEQEGEDLFAMGKRYTSAMEGTMRGIEPAPGFLPKSWTVFNWTPRQLEALSSKARFLALPCGRGSGKSEISFRRLVISLGTKHEKTDNPLYFYAAPVNKQSMRIGWWKLLSLIPPSWIVDIKKSDQYIETIFGSRVYVLGMDKPERIEGNQWAGGIVDESSDQKPGSFGKSITPALTHYDGWCWRIGVPKRQGIGAAEYRDFCEDADKGDDPNRASFWWPSSDVLTEQQLDEVRRNLDAIDYEEQFGAVWQRTGGGIFHSFDTVHNVRSCSYDRDLPLIVGCDFNVSPMSWVFAHIYDQTIEFFDELRVTDTNTMEQLDRAYERYSEHNTDVIFFIDASGIARRSCAESSDYIHIINHAGFKKLGRTIAFPEIRDDGTFEGNPALKDRFSACNARMCNANGIRNLFIDPSCEYLIKDFRNRYIDPKTGKPADPSGTDMGHMSDAAGYIINKLWPILAEFDWNDPEIVTTEQEYY